MDNGHPKNMVNNVAPGVNSASENAINEQDWQRALETSAPAAPASIVIPPFPPVEKPNNPSEAIVSEPLGPSEQISPTEGAVIPAASGNPNELGQIVPMNPVPQGQPTPVADATQVYNSSSIKTTGDRLEKTSFAEIKKAEAKLDQDQNLADFNAIIRGDDEKQGMFADNLDNSFGRKFGEDQIGKAA